MNDEFLAVTLRTLPLTCAATLFSVTLPWLALSTRLPRLPALTVPLPARLPVAKFKVIVPLDTVTPVATTFRPTA